ncbi:MAG: MaoC family dehydratase [Acidimicrobiales bacterium]
MSAPNPGDEVVDLPAIAPLTVAYVDPQRMKTMAALLRDPYPIHWDPESVADEVHGGRTVNQGPLNLAYVANMLMAWAGDTSIRKLTASFHAHVLAGDTVTASGEVEEVFEADGERRARCAVRLVRGSDLIVSGQAEVSLDMLDRHHPSRGEPAGQADAGVSS